MTLHIESLGKPGKARAERQLEPPILNRAAFRAEAEGVLQLVCDDRDLDAEARKACDSFKEHLAQVKIDAIEIRKASDAKHYRFTLGNTLFEVPTLSRNDAHTLQQLGNGQCTFVKMTGLSFEGLRRALRFSDTRIRHVQPPSQSSWIEGIRIRSGTGVLGDVILGFSPNLSCVIGARGAGKSAIVDGLRYAFGYNRNMGQGIGEDLRKQVIQRQEATLAGATIEIQYRTASQDSYLLVSDYQSNRDYSSLSRLSLFSCDCPAFLGKHAADVILAYPDEAERRRDPVRFGVFPAHR